MYWGIIQDRNNSLFFTLWKAMAIIQPCSVYQATLSCLPNRKVYSIFCCMGAQFCLFSWFSLSEPFWYFQESFPHVFQINYKSYCSITLLLTSGLILFFYSIDCYILASHFSWLREIVSVIINLRLFFQLYHCSWELLPQ